MIKYILIVMLLIGIAWLSLFAGYILGKDSLHRKIDTRMLKAYEMAVRSKGVSEDFVKGMEYADNQIMSVLHGWEAKNDKADQTTTM